jgi:hypothetical protein
VAEKRKPGFNIPLNFYDGPEVESIPKRIRAAAIGVWALAGDYAATQLTDGYVGAGLLRQIGCTDAIRAALKVTINKKGELSPLWIEGRNGGVQLTNWPKHQRTNDEVTTYRASEAERKRGERAAKRKPSTSDNNETSGRTTVGQSTDVRSDARDPKTETETKTENSGYVPESASLSTARDAQAATPGADLVRELIPTAIPDSERTMLRIKASALLREGSTREDVAEGLRLYLAKPHLGAGALPALVSEAIRSRTAPAKNGSRMATSDLRVAQTQALKSVPSQRLELQ